MTPQKNLRLRAKDILPTGVETIYLNGPLEQADLTRLLGDGPDLHFNILPEAGGTPMANRSPDDQTSVAPTQVIRDVFIPMDGYVTPDYHPLISAAANYMGLMLRLKLSCKVAFRSITDLFGVTIEHPSVKLLDKIVLHANLDDLISSNQTIIAMANRVGKWIECNELIIEEIKFDVITHVRSLKEGELPEISMVFSLFGTRNTAK